MKKFLYTISVLLAALTVFTACGPSSSPLTMATGGVSGTYYSFGLQMSNMLNKNARVNIEVNNTGASKENLYLLANREAQLAIVQNDSLYYANTGIELFAGEQLSGISVISRLYPEACQIVISPNSGIHSVSDMKGKKISIGDYGSGVEANALQILGIYGLTENDIDAAHLSFAESAEAYKNNEIDGFFVTSGIPNAAISELLEQKEIIILPIEEDKIQALINKYPFYAKEIIPSGTYGSNREIATVSVQAVLACSSDLNDSLVYQLTKTLFEKQYEIDHEKTSDMYLTRAMDGIEVSLMHPGALRYLKEVGLAD